ncbi:Gamma-butyrobetaine dioxygenase [Trichoplax sp. H2]|nr:Gamma-butyrobetaine dioxygenase [Trichoplax sp. H2]|eukprot:RDD38635.1 Gamma-butyrobetaine dioxygenase [Trichoplax sp. H2]
MAMFSSTILNIENRVQDKLISVTWDDGKTTNYPHIYLRDNCCCSSCFDPQTQQRSISNAVYHNYANATIKTARVDDKNDKLYLEWINDGEHTTSNFELDWLKAHRSITYDDIEVNPVTKQLWGSEMKNNLPQFDYNKILNDDSELHRWVRCMLKVGISLLVGLPEDIGQVKKSTFKIHTDKGDDLTTIAYKNGGLAMHTDLVYYESVPGILLLHCLRPAKQGGENQVADGFKAAEQLKASHPEYFDILTKYAIRYQDEGTDVGLSNFNQIAYHPVIRLNYNGDIKQIAYADHARCSKLIAPSDKVLSFYNAMTQFLQYAYDPANMVQFKLQSGCMIALDNYRIMHGRTGFEESADSIRFIEGGYVDWDEALSRMRVIEKELAIN